MKRIGVLLAITSLMAVNSVFAQSNVSKPKSFNITSKTAASTTNYKSTSSSTSSGTSSAGQTKKVVPPILTVIGNSISFTDGNNNNIIDAEEACYIKFTLKNEGKGDAVGCTVNVQLTGSTNGISVSSQKVDRLAAGQSRVISVPVKSGLNTVDGNVGFLVKVDEPNKMGTDPFSISVQTKKYVSPYLKVVDHLVTSSTGKIEKRFPITLDVQLQNIQYGVAENVTVSISLPKDVQLLEETSTRFTSMEGGAKKDVKYTFYANSAYSAPTIPVTITIKERHGKYAENKTISIPLNQTVSTISRHIEAREEKFRPEIQVGGTLTSDVDKDIPQTYNKNTNTLAVIIANENYENGVAPVEFALNDGKIFKQYCQKVLGITNENMIYYKTDASGGIMRGAISWLKDGLTAFPNARVIFYYAGHGYPDESNRTAYLLPVDIAVTNLGEAIKLDDLYKDLGELQSQLVTVFIDACFSGSKREGDMIVSARGAVVKPREDEPVGNTVVFTASKGEQTAHSYKEKQHGMFTYFLLKKLKETKGEVTLAELMDYITTNVKQSSFKNTGKVQQPNVIPSVNIGETWRTKKLF